MGNLNLPTLTENQNNKEDTINTKDDRLDIAITDRLDVTVASSNAATISEVDTQRHAVFFIQEDDGDPPTDTITITFDVAFRRGSVSIINETGRTVQATFTGQAETPPTIPAGDTSMLTLDGDDVRLAGGGGGGGDIINNGPVNQINQFSGCRLRKNASQAIPSGVSTILDWQTEEFDTAGFHDNVTNNSRITIPADLGITKVRLSCNLDFDTPNSGVMRGFFSKNGDILLASSVGGQSVTGVSGSEVLSIESGPVEVVDGDYFEVVVFTANSGQVDNTVATNFSLIVVEQKNVEAVAVASGRPFRGALVYKNATQTNVGDAAFPGTALTWELEEYDTDDFHDTVTNNTRVTIPSGLGITKVRLMGNAQFNAPTSADLQIAVRKNGADVQGMGAQLQSGGTNRRRVNISSAPLEVVDGDYFEVFAWVDNTSNDDVEVAEETWFAIEVVEDKANNGNTFAQNWAVPFRGARATSTTTQAIGAAADTAVVFDSEAYDTDGIHDNVTNNQRLTVPAGITRVRLTACLETSTPGTGAMQAWIAKNGGAFPGEGGQALNAFTGSELMSLSTGVVDVVPGDYFEVYVNFANAGSITNGGATWFMMEIVEDEDSARRPYDLFSFFNGTPAASQIVDIKVADRAFTLELGLGNSQAYVATTDAGAVSYPIQKNGAPIGSVDFAGGANVATFTFGANQSFVVGDRLEILAPGGGVGTQADLAITLEAVLP